ncbi:hypothetical protein [Massilia sp. Dwa41.01b]|nr:hypothetical protein [Massilia sp. Dwa41.01b]
MAAAAAGVDTKRFEERPAAAQGTHPIRPVYSALGTERGLLMPPLGDALVRYAALRADPTQYIAARSNQ